MGIEYIIVNPDKKEFLDFDRLGFGTKLGAMTSEPIASILSWLLVNQEGFIEPPPAMLGRWAGDRVEIIGDEEIGYERQSSARKEFLDITVEAIAGFAAETGSTEFKAMGLIDKDGAVVVNPAERDSVAHYWEVAWQEDAKESEAYLAKWEKMEATLRSGSASEVKRLRSPRTGGPLRIQYIHTKADPPYFRISDPPERIIYSPLARCRPSWIDVLGEDFLTEPGDAEQDAPPASVS
jgi:hypothetical protein